MFLPGAGASLQMCLLTLITFCASEVHKLNFNIDKGVTVSINGSSLVKSCRLCTGTKLFRRCDQTRQFKDKLSADLECPRRQDVFRAFAVKIEQKIECSTNSCNGHILQSDSSFLPLLDFNRTFTWSLSASEQTAFRIDFTGTGLRQIPPSETCPDGRSYTLRAAQATGSVTVGKYCRVGIISSAQILNRGSFSVDAAAGQKLNNVQFDVTVGEKIQSFAKISLTFPTGSSSSELLSPNFPNAFPDDDDMEWYLQIPDKHRTSVQFLNVTQPRCLKKKTAVEYQSPGRAAWVRSLTDPQPDHDWGDVSLTLRNCQTDRKAAGLAVNIQVSVSASPASRRTLILSVVTAVLATSVLVLLVTCLVIKRKRVNQNPQTSIYNPNFSTAVLPAAGGFSKPSPDDDHVYETIDETQVYSHLLNDDVNIYTEFDGDGNTFLPKPQTQ